MKTTKTKLLSERRISRIYKKNEEEEQKQECACVFVHRNGLFVLNDETFVLLLTLLLL